MASGYDHVDLFGDNRAGGRAGVRVWVRSGPIEGEDAIGVGRSTQNVCHGRIQVEARRDVLDIVCPRNVPEVPDPARDGNIAQIAAAMDEDGQSRLCSRYALTHHCA
jgi:hypothetical protein